VASRTIVQIEDDLDGGEASETLNFAIDGKSYAIDLSAKNADNFRAALGPYVGAARREGSIAKPFGRKSSTTTDVDPKAVRAWARSNGHSINARGRVGADIVTAYKAAGN
jgi:hypothetical protein